MKKWVLEIICLLYVLLFAYAAVSKLADYNTFTEQLTESPLSRFAKIIAWLTPATELLLALLLVIPKTRKLALYGSFLLMLSFTVYIIYILKFSPDIPCSCGGILENMNWTQHLVFNIAFTLLALAGIILQRYTSGYAPFIRLRSRLLYGSMGVLVLVVIGGAVSVSAIGIHQPPPIKPGAPMPEFPIQLMTDSNAYFNTKDIPEGKPTMLVYFLPNCGHCQDELIQLTLKTDSLAGMQVYFISGAPWKKIHALYKAMDLSRFSQQITLGADTSHYFNKTFNPFGTPYHALYNKNRKLARIIPRQATMQEIYEFVREQQ